MEIMEYGKGGVDTDRVIVFCMPGFLPEELFHQLS